MCIVYVFVVYTQTSRSVCAAYGLLLLLHSSLFVCCASFAVCALFCAQTMRTESSGKNWRKKVRQKLLAALFFWNELCEGAHGEGGGEVG